MRCWQEPRKISTLLNGKVKIKDSEGITREKVEAFFNDNYRAETTQEAGGYFCRMYRYLPVYDNEAVLIVFQQYDI